MCAVKMWHLLEFDLGPYDVPARRTNDEFGICHPLGDDCV